ncbi:hypothetical protein [Carnimonas bestiolae]|uniref:hypothetical protein n=1 Tax=Carnimonas bestiolae TaxID=3402172 RepID=UPI003EDBA05C
MTAMLIAIVFALLAVGLVLFAKKALSGRGGQVGDSLENLLHELASHVDTSETHKQLSEDFENAAHQVADEVHGRIANVKEKLGDILPEREHE